MRTRSACIAVLLAVTAGTALTLSACANDATSPAVTQDPAHLTTERKVKELEDRYSWIGQYHTDGLAFVLSKLQENGEKKNPDAPCKVAARAVKEFHKAARKAEVPLAFLDPSLASEVCPAREPGMSPSRETSVSASSGPTELSLEALAYMDQVYAAIYAATDRAALLSTLHSIEYAAAGNLRQSEAGAVVAVVSIAISSMDYWEANLDSWVSIPGTTSTPYARGDDSVPVLAATMPIRTQWWKSPFVRGYIKVVGADAVGGGRVLYTTWYTGVIGWDAAAAAALWSSTAMTLSLLF